MTKMPNHGVRIKKPYTEKTCPERWRHTPQPDGYLQWHEWAEQMKKTHVQERCPCCGLWAIVVKKINP